VKSVEDRMTELETRLEFQDETIARLNDELVAQQQDITRLTKTMTLMIDQFSKQGSNMMDVLDMVDEKDEPPPPHY
jgi:SlyX protein